MKLLTNDTPVLLSSLQNEEGDESSLALLSDHHSSFSSLDTEEPSDFSSSSFLTSSCSSGLSLSLAEDDCVITEQVPSRAGLEQDNDNHKSAPPLKSCLKKTKRKSRSSSKKTKEATTSTTSKKKKSSSSKTNSSSKKKSRKSVSFPGDSNNEDEAGVPLCTICTFEETCDNMDEEGDCQQHWWTQEDLYNSRWEWQQTVMKLWANAECMELVTKISRSRNEKNITRNVKKLGKRFPLVRGLETHLLADYREQCALHRILVLDTVQEVYKYGLANTDEGAEILRGSSRETSRKLTKIAKKFQ